MSQKKVRHSPSLLLPFIPLYSTCQMLLACYAGCNTYVTKSGPPPVLPFIPIEITFLALPAWNAGCNNNATAQCLFSGCQQVMQNTRVHNTMQGSPLAPLYDPPSPCMYVGEILDGDEVDAAHNQAKGSKCVTQTGSRKCNIICTSFWMTINLYKDREEII